MANKTKLIRMRDVLTETQRCNINSLFKKYELKFTKKISMIERCDMRKITKSCCYISLKDIDNLLKKVETKFEKTKNMNTKISITTVKAIRKDIESFLDHKQLKGTL
ncbi:hypothetical protein ACOTVS_02025 [Aliarcobacter butzleri]|jgi:predicted DNA-binding protein YlxM (UPF0122 family)|uniref:hypothetical protein n=1 Tax=Aliarcobacter butzleri TaxID=28197 RepID=UPI0012F81521|nr:hypothetical protein [Aliarcobacter butzleri]MCG3696893.1 hypothetical protein [Aliarcobacter butzleri]MCT7651026.1 hypothetical protein [Aliarcobacter butzleri]